MAVAPRCRNGKASSITVVAGTVCCQRHCDLGCGLISHVSLVEILIPFCVMAIATVRSTRLLSPRRCVPSHMQPSRRSVAEHSATGSVLPRKSVVSWLISISTPLLTTTSVMLQQ